MDGGCVIDAIEPDPDFHEIYVIEQTPKGPVKHMFRGKIKIIGQLVSSQELGVSNEEEKEPELARRKGRKFKNEGGIEIISERK
jgi:hypothetical protein